jgi:hypothetical protein
MKRVNIGCGMSPTPGWLNCDGSFSVVLSTYPVLAFLFKKSGLLSADNQNFLAFAKASGITPANARAIPLPTGSVEVLYSSHMLEHLDRDETKRFLKEAYRVLCHQGVIRLVVPDLQLQAQTYLREQDGDEFLGWLQLARPRPRTLKERLRALVGVDRSYHRWMYDAKSLTRLLLVSGFRNPVIQPPGSTIIQNPEPLNLREREQWSLYVEALR